jgi:hypothetical protein
MPPYSKLNFFLSPIYVSILDWLRKLQNDTIDTFIPDDTKNEGKTKSAEEKI